MKNNKVIVIYGFQRGGTNIVYNIFQSHPLVCSPNDLETGEIISQNYRIRSHKKFGYLIKRIKLWFYDVLNIRAETQPGCELIPVKGCDVSLVIQTGIR